MLKTKAKTIDAFLNEVNPLQAAFIQAFRSKILKMVPEAAECIHFSTPSFKYLGKPFVGIGPLNEGYSFYPYSNQIISQFKKELEGFEYSPKTIHVSEKNQLSDELLQKLIFARIMEIEEQVERKK